MLKRWKGDYNRGNSSSFMVMNKSHKTDNKKTIPVKDYCREINCSSTISAQVMKKGGGDIFGRKKA